MSCPILGKINLFQNVLMLDFGKYTAKLKRCVIRKDNIQSMVIITKKADGNIFFTDSFYSLH